MSVESYKTDVEKLESTLTSLFLFLKTPIKKKEINIKIPGNILSCSKCGTDLNFNFIHYIYQGRRVCGFCNSQDNEEKLNLTERKIQEDFDKASKSYIQECFDNEASPAVILESFKKLIEQEIKVILKDAQKND